MDANYEAKLGAALQAEREAIKGQYHKRQMDTAEPIPTGSLGGYGVDAEYRPTLRDRLKRQIDDAGRNQRRAREANELFDLLNKNPEVARILELLETMGH